MLPSGPMPGSCLWTQQTTIISSLDLTRQKQELGNHFSVCLTNKLNKIVLTFGHIRMGTVASGPSACCPWGLVGLCYTALPSHCWVLATWTALQLKNRKTQNISFCTNRSPASSLLLVLSGAHLSSCHRRGPWWTRRDPSAPSYPGRPSQAGNPESWESERFFWKMLGRHHQQKGLANSRYSYRRAGSLLAECWCWILWFILVILNFLIFSRLLHTLFLKFLLISSLGWFFVNYYKFKKMRNNVDLINIVLH